jgi:hypothetical protein
LGFAAHSAASPIMQSSAAEAAAAPIAIAASVILSVTIMRRMTRMGGRFCICEGPSMVSEVARFAEKFFIQADGVAYRTTFWPQCGELPRRENPRSARFTLFVQSFFKV